MAVAAFTGATVSFRSVPGFDSLPFEEASRIIYDELVPACEGKGVFLSDYGNHAGQGSLMKVEKYNELKEEHQLFNVPRIKKAFKGLPDIVQTTSRYMIGSYGLKHDVERWQGEYLTNGDCIAAMLLRGYQARFGKRNEVSQVNCEFKVKTLPG